MWRLTTALLLASFIAASTGAENDVLVLSDDDFDSTLKRHETTLVMFFAPWCVHCNRLKPEYAKAAEIVKDDEPPIKLAKIDCTDSGKEICNKYSIRGYPTLKLFRQNEVLEDYNGPRKAAGIVKYMRAQVKQPFINKKMHTVAQLAKLADLAEYLDNKEASLLSYFSDIDSKLVRVLVKIADKNREKYGLGPMF